MKVVSKKYAGLQEVYDIGIDSDEHNFVLENGAIASNCFNKSHSVCYSMLTYISAYLKANYPIEFFCSLMSIRSQAMQPKLWAAKAPEYLYEARMLGVDIHAPCVNKSGIGFLIKEDGIYFGLNAIRDVGKTAARSIVAARRRAPFTDILNFLSRVNRQKVTRKVFSALIYAGAFDKMGYSRSELHEVSDALYEHLNSYQAYAERTRKIAQWEEESIKTEKLISDRDELRKKDKASKRKRNPGPELSTTETEYLERLEEMKLRRTPRPKDLPNPEDNIPTVARYKNVPVTVDQLIEQASYIGCFVGRHPAHIVCPGTDLIRSSDTGAYVNTAGMVNSFKVITTRRGRKMAFMEIGDESGMAEIIVFPNTFAKLEETGTLPEPGQIVSVEGKCETTDPIIKVIGNKITISRG